MCPVMEVMTENFSVIIMNIESKDSVWKLTYQAYDCNSNYKHKNENLNG